VVSNSHVRQANLKVILELTGSQCSSDRRAGVAGCCERLGEQLRFAHVVIFDAGSLFQFHMPNSTNSKVRTVVFNITVDTL